MPQPLIGLRVFVASPGGLDDERDEFRRTLLAFNEDHAHHAGITFIPVGWELVVPGAERPQARINREIHSSDYFALILWDRWGSPPDTTGDFTSGSHEEFSVAAECLADPEYPMRDIAVFFKGVDERSLSDPGDQLQAVRRFKQGLEANKELMYKTFDDLSELSRLMQRLMSDWSMTYEVKQARRITDPMKEPQAEQPTELGVDLEALLQRALDLEQQGFVTQAEATFAAAVLSKDPAAMVAYAQFLRRTGRLAAAFEVNEDILRQENLLLDESDVGRSRRAYVVANMGVIRRKQGNLDDSRRLLAESANTARLAGEAGTEALAYALDNLGLTLRRHGEVNAALAAYEEARALRTARGDEYGAAKSTVNMSRLVRHEHPDRAVADLRDAVAIFEAEGDRRETANALVALGEALVMTGELERAEQQMRRALEINETLRHTDGIAVTTGQLADVLLRQGRLDEADNLAMQSLEANIESANYEGMAIALRRLGESRIAQELFGEAAQYLEQALTLMVRQGNRHGEKQVLGALAPLYESLQRNEEAVQHRQRLEELA